MHNLGDITCEKVWIWLKPTGLEQQYSPFCKSTWTGFECSDTESCDRLRLACGRPQTLAVFPLRVSLWMITKHLLSQQSHLFGQVQTDVKVYKSLPTWCLRSWVGEVDFLLGCDCGGLCATTQVSFLLKTRRGSVGPVLFTTSQGTETQLPGPQGGLVHSGDAELVGRSLGYLLVGSMETPPWPLLILFLLTRIFYCFSK